MEHYTLTTILMTLWSFIQPNLPIIVAYVFAALMLLFQFMYYDKVIQYRKAKNIAKDATEHANTTMLLYDDLDKTYKQIRSNFSELSNRHESELMHKDNCYKAQIDNLRAEIRNLKDERRAEAMDMAYCYCSDDKNADGTLKLDNSLLIETANKIYRFYIGK